MCLLGDPTCDLHVAPPVITGSPSYALPIAPHGSLWKYW